MLAEESSGRKTGNVDAIVGRDVYVSIRRSFVDTLTKDKLSSGIAT